MIFAPSRISSTPEKEAGTPAARVAAKFNFSQGLQKETIMRASRFQAVLVLAAALVLSLSHGSARKVMVETFGYQDHAAVSLEERARDQMLQQDYVDPGANVNNKDGNLFSPPRPPQTPPPPPPPHRRF